MTAVTSLSVCKRGNIASRDKWGHCLCSACKAYTYAVQNRDGRKKAYKKIWGEKNPDKMTAYCKKWIANNKEKRACIVNSWRSRNPEKVKMMNAKAGKKWAANNKGLRNASYKARQIAIKRGTPAWVNTDAIKAIYKEAQRLTIETGIYHEVDHIIPLQGELVCGLHVPNNLQIIPRSVNRSKKNKFQIL